MDRGDRRGSTTVMGTRLRHIEWEIVNVLAPTILSNVEGCVVDIGIGPSTEILRKHSKDFGVKHYSCDILPYKCEWARSVGCEAYEMESLDFIKQFDKQSIALIFIDGWHKYELVKQEVAFFLPQLLYGGVMFLHDTNPPEIAKADNGRHCGDVYKLRPELEQDNSLQVFTWPYTAARCGLTMIMKKVVSEK